MAFNIGEILFREILGMNIYPGSPFTGNMFQDIILFLFVPTVFLIIFVYIASAIVVPPENGKLRLLMGIAIYAFIIASRYYQGFAILASQFYLPLVILIALIYFFSRHFRRPGQPPGGTMRYRADEGFEYNRGHGRDKGSKTMRSEIRGGGFDMMINPGERNRIHKRLEEIRHELPKVKKDLDEAYKHPGAGDKAAGHFAEKLSELEEEEYFLNKKLKFE